MTLSQKQWAALSARFDGLSGGAVKVLAAMETVRCRSTGWITITITNLAARVGCCRASMFRYLGELVAKGRLMVVNQWSQAGQRANRYRLVDWSEDKVAEARREREQRRKVAYTANTVKRQGCLKAWGDKVERYVWGRISAYMSADSMGLNVGTPLLTSGFYPVSAEEAAQAFRGVHLTLWQQRGRIRR